MAVERTRGEPPESSFNTQVRNYAQQVGERVLTMIDESKRFPMKKPPNIFESDTASDFLRKIDIPMPLPVGDSMVELLYSYTIVVEKDHPIFDLTKISSVDISVVRNVLEEEPQYFFSLGLEKRENEWVVEILNRGENPSDMEFTKEFVKPGEVGLMLQQVNEFASPVLASGESQIGITQRRS